MTDRRKKIEEIVEMFGVVYIMIGFLLGALFAYYIAQGTTLINVKHEDQACVSVTIDNEPAQQVCKGEK